MKHTYPHTPIMPLFDSCAFVLLPVCVFLCVAISLSIGQVNEMYDPQVAKTIEQLEASKNAK